MRALLVTVALLLVAAAPAAARPRQGVKTPACAAVKAGAAKYARRAAPRRRAARPRACARLGKAGLAPGSRLALAGVAPAAPAPSATSPTVPAAPGAPAPATPSATPTPEPTPAGPVLPPVFSNPFAVQVQAFEFGLQLSKTTVSAGNVRVEFNLARAEDPHNLFLVRNDGTGPAYSFDESPSGAVLAKTFPLSAGRWTLFCALPGHEAAGMRTSLTVAG